MKNSKLWLEAFESTSDQYVDERALLLSTLNKMREHVSFIVEQISNDCPGLTIHNISHLDKLWEMADLISGTKVKLNPLEAFTFGASILLHDTGMAVAAFLGAQAELENSVTWKDHEALLRQKNGIANDAALPDNMRPLIRFLTLRSLHSQQAKNLACQAWKHPTKHEQIFLIEDEGLRSGLGQLIGKIAASHHWNYDQLEEFAIPFGVPSGMPSQWAFNPLLLACLLRCSDAAHISSDRAPSFVYALTNPEGESKAHWEFQNKLLNPTVEGNKLLYRSGHPFNKESVNAWWLAFDTVSMINRELQSSNDLLRAKGLGQFAIEGVHGANLPRSLAKYIQPTGWDPVDARIATSNPASVAAKLGGENLYGSNPLIALRELVQNSVDAIRNRRAITGQGRELGLIKVKLLKDEDDSRTLVVEDNGIGMSKRVMAGSLIDFGNSMWDGPVAQSEFPGLLSKNVDRIGKFGIGFFASFILGGQVSVASRRFDRGDDELSVLEFQGLSGRQILRPGTRPQDCPYEVSTQIKIVVDRRWNSIPTTLNSAGRGILRAIDKSNRKQTLEAGVKLYLGMLVAALDIRVTLEIEDEIVLDHDANWELVDPEQFLQDLVGLKDDAYSSGAFAKYNNLMSPIKNDKDVTIGRAALLLSEDVSLHLKLSFVSISGISVAGPDIEGLPYVGVIPGEIEDIRRSTATPVLERPMLESWVAGQLNIIKESKTSLLERVATGHRLYAANIETGDLEFAYLGGDLLTKAALIERLTSLSEIVVPIDSRFGNELKLFSIGRLGIGYLLDKPNDNFLVMAIENSKFVGVAKGDEIEFGEDIPISDMLRSFEFNIFIKVLDEVWGADNYKFKTDKVRYFHQDYHRPAQQGLIVTRMDVDSGAGQN